MNYEVMTERLFQALITGDRDAARSVVEETIAESVPAEEVAHELYFPVLEMIGNLYRADQLTTLAHHYATRLLRLLVDQTQARYEQQPRNGRRILMFSGTEESDELIGQMTADLAEASGYEVCFGGGGIAGDEILAEVGDKKPDILLMFASAASDAPNIRMIIDTIHSVHACPNLQIVVGGGVFKRAEGLAEEIGADLWANTPAELLYKLDDESQRRATPDQRTVGRTRRPGKTQAA